MRASDQRFSQRRIQGTERERVLAQLVGIVCPSIATGMLFIQGFENWLRGIILDACASCCGFSGRNNFILPKNLADNSLAALPTQRCFDTR